MKNNLVVFVAMMALIVGCNKKAKNKEINSEKISYDVVFRENSAGKYEKWKADDGSFEYYFTYTDRGRGPEYHEKIILNDQNYITQQHIEGVNYRKVAVNESFSSNGDNATWTNPKESGKGTFYGDQLYFRFDGSPASEEILAQLLIKSDNGTIKLYPEGEAGLVNKFPQKLSNGKDLELLMIKGLNMTPVYLWMDGDQMVCSISGNLHIVRDDYKDFRKEMKGIQDAVEDDYLLELSTKLTHPVNKVIIKDANVFTAKGTLLEHQDVLVEAGTIKNIYPTDKTSMDTNVEVFEASGKTLMPGMFDMHTHNTKFRGILHIAGGVTSVRDLANNKQLKDLADQFNKNEIIGPGIVTFCGIIDGSGPYANQRNVVNTLEEGLAEIQDYKDLGYDQIKLYSSIRPEWVGPLTKKAHDLGMRVSGHIPAYMTASQAIDLGYNEIQHMNMLFLNFLSDTIDTRTPLRFTMVADHGLNLDLKSKEYLDFIDQLKNNNILVDPTVAIFENMFVSQKGEPSPTYSKIMDRLPLIEQRAFYAGGLPKTEETTPIFKQSHDKMLDVVYDLNQKGVAIVPGTDGLPGFLYHRELELYNKSGIPASEVLQIATIKSAEITGVDEFYGSIEIGKKADLILIDGNPLENISDIRKVEWTMKGGNLFLAEELYSSMGIKHFK